MKYALEAKFTREYNGHIVSLTNPEKIFWPKEKICKGELIDYYERIAPYILPHLFDRPQSLNRYPNGIEKQSFYHKNLSDNNLPSWAKTVPILSDSEGRTINYLLCQNLETLIYMVNLGCIEINPWNSRYQNEDYPDYIVLDFDPEDIEFRAVIRAVKATKDILDQIGVEAYCKTSGATGIHVYLPTGGVYTYEQVQQFAKLILFFVHQKLPNITSLERSPRKRQKKVYLDYLQNRKGQTMAAPYSVRPRPGATVSTPLEWSELDHGLKPEKFNLKNAYKRLQRKGDLWENAEKPLLDMVKTLDMIKSLKL